MCAEFLVLLFMGWNGFHGEIISYLLHSYALLCQVQLRHHIFGWSLAELVRNKNKQMRRGLIKKKYFENIFEKEQDCLHFPRTNEHRSSHRRCSIRKDVLWNFPKFTGKHLFYRTPPGNCFYKQIRLKNFKSSKLQQNAWFRIDE